jgi:hypothetical protein
MQPLRIAETVGNVAVRCLECDHVYVKPNEGGTISTNPGCPLCGYVGWASLTPTLRGRSGADRPRHPRVRRR